MFYTWLTWNLKTYPLIIILILGFLGNGFIFYIFLRPNFKSSSITKYMRILAVTDTILIFVGIVPNVYEGFNRKSLLIRSDAGCILQRFIMFFIGDISVWILIAITIDRLVAVVFPIQNTTWKSHKNSIVILIVVFSLSLIKNFPIFFTLSVVTNTNGTRFCDTRERFAFYERKIRPFISLMMYYLIPTIIMTICTVVIILKMNRVAKKLDVMTNPKRRLSMEINNVNFIRPHYSKSLTQMSIAINILFVLLLSPSIFIWTIISYWPASIQSEKISILYDSTNILVFSHHSLNFYLFFLSGPRFRKEVLQIFGKNYGSILDSKNESIKTAPEQLKEIRLK